MKNFTVWVEDVNGGTCHVSAHRADDIEGAKAAAIRETAKDWGYPPPRAALMLNVLGVAKGDVTLLEWNDE